MIDAKAKVLAYILEKGEVDTDEIVNDLKLDLEMVVEALDELVKENKISAL